MHGPTPPGVLAGTATPSTDAAPQAQIPQGSLVVAPGGDDSASGTVAAPLATIGAALARVDAEGTIVLRGGSWHESVAMTGAPGVTLRAWPGEKVWLDGSEPLTSADFAPAGSGQWRLAGFELPLDTSPTFVRGAPDNLEPGWRFVNPRYPLAADPHQLWRDGVALRQVNSLRELSPDAFYLDGPGRALYVGADPRGHELRVGTLAKALVITAPRTRIEGIGIRRFVPSVPDFGAVTVDGTGTTMRDVIVRDVSTIGVSVQSKHVTLERLTISGSGLLGLHAHLADDLAIREVTVTDSNTRHFNHAPTAAGAKITMTRGLQVQAGSFSKNNGTGLWLDESVVDATITGTTASNNALHGIHVELSAGVHIDGAVLVGNLGDGICVQNSNRLHIEHSRAAANRRQLNFIQDGRRPSDQGASQRLRVGRAGVPTWVLGDTRVNDNTLAEAAGLSASAAVTSGDAIIAVEDFTKVLDAPTLGFQLRDNTYVTDPRARTRWTHVWTRPGSDPAVYGSVASFQAATGQDVASAQMSTRQFARTTASPQISPNLPPLSPTP